MAHFYSSHSRTVRTEMMFLRQSSEGGGNVARTATGVASLYSVVAATVATVATVAARWLAQ